MIDIPCFLPHTNGDCEKFAMALISGNQNKWARAANFIGRPVIAFSVTALFVGINAWAVMEHPIDKQIAKPAQQETEQAFDLDYATIDYSFQDVNNAEK